MNTSDLFLYAVTERSCIKNDLSLAEAVELALKGGVTMVQLREKELGFDEFVSSAREIKELCRKYRVPLIINDNIDVCLAVDADGVHLGQGDTPLKEARERLGADKIIGVTAKTIEQAQAAERDGADYLGSGDIFGTSTKVNTARITKIQLREICASVSIPVVAIGGIRKANIARLTGTGIAGIAVASGIFGAKDIYDTTMDLGTRLKGAMRR